MVVGPGAWPVVTSRGFGVGDVGELGDVSDEEEVPDETDLSGTADGGDVPESDEQLDQSPNPFPGSPA